MSYDSVLVKRATDFLRYAADGTTAGDCLSVNLRLKKGFGLETHSAVNCLPIAPSELSAGACMQKAMLIDASLDQKRIEG
jgi:hypothetical protein